MKFRPRSHRSRALLIWLGAICVRLVYFVTISETACLAINLDPVSDMEAFHRWGLALVEGDWLDRENFHPYHPWQTAVAPPSQWESWYGDVFHQEPLYPYLIATIYLMATREPTTVILFQLFLGAAGCSCIYLAGRRLMPEGAALIAGAASALYGPYLYYESLILRDSLMIPLNSLLIWLLGEARFRSRGRPASAWWLGVGVLCGTLYITKVSILPFVIAFAVWHMWEGRGPLVVERIRQTSLILAGGMVVLAPVVARNLVVEAPALKITTRGPIEFINGNNSWHSGIGWFDGSDPRISAYARETLDGAGGRLLPTIRRVLADWRGNPVGFIHLQLRKTAYFLAPFEMPNNASYGYFRENSRLLRYGTLSFFWVSPFALLGLLHSIRRWRDFVPVYLFLAAGFMVTIAFYVIARFRAPLVPAIILLAALGLWSAILQARSRMGWGLCFSCAVIAASLAANAATDYADRELTRPQDYFIAMKEFRTRGRLLEAIQEAERGREIFPGFSEFAREAGDLYLEVGLPREALDAYREILSRNPRDAQAREAVERLERLMAP